MKNKPTLKLTGEDGNAFSIMGRGMREMRNFSRDNPSYDAQEMIQKYQSAATSGDYDHLLQVTMEYFEVS